MILLITGLCLFIGVHLIPSRPRLRSQLVDRWGIQGYRALFAALSLLGFSLLVWGKAQAPFYPIYSPPSWGYQLPVVLMLPALILVCASQLPSRLRGITRHPMLWGVVLWSISHLAANGDVASIVLFGGIGGYSLFAMWSANRRGATLSRRSVSLAQDALVIGIGFLAYLAFAHFHPMLFGVLAIPV